MGFLKKKDKKEDAKNVSSIQMDIRIYRLLSNRTPVRIASFVAEQQKDSENIVLINEGNGFKEDLTIIKDNVIEDLTYRLNLSEKSKDDKVKIIEKAIKKQEKLVTRLGKTKEELKDELEAKRKEDNKDKKEAGLTEQEEEIEDTEIEKERIKNKISEETKLRQYKVLLYEVKHDSEGSFEVISENGKREISYLFYDGLLFPYFWNAPVDNGSVLTLHPAMGIKKKIFMEKLDEIFKDFFNDTKEKGSALVKNVLTIATIIMFIASLILFVVAFNNAVELPEKYGDRCMDYASQCSEITNSIAIANGELIKYAIEERKLINDTNVETTVEAITPSNKIINMVTGN